VVEIEQLHQQKAKALICQGEQTPAAGSIHP
jgi:hypothetical protein